MQHSVLVLGANGFIGKAVVAALGASGWATPILGVRRPSGGNPTYAERRVEAQDSGSVASAMQGVSAVVDCVAGPPKGIVSSSQALLRAAASSGSSARIVHLSTMSVYGSAVGLVDETSVPRGDAGPYSAAKLAAEKLAAAYPHAVIFRPGIVYGPGSEQWSVRIARLLYAHRLGDLGAAGDGSCNLVHVHDVAAAIVSALSRSDTDGGVFNLSTPLPPSWNDYFIRFAKALGAVPVRRLGRRRLQIETKLLAPALKIAEIAGRAGKIPARLLPPPIPPSLLRLMGQDIRLDTRRVEAALGIRWRDLDTALQETAHWYQANRR
jgi:nucleoside-diphosphate-sugar epimerase